MIIDSSVIAEALCITARGVRKKADREGWASTTESGLGGKKIKFALKDLPENIQAKVILHLHKTGQIKAPASDTTEKAPAIEQEWTPEHSRQLWDWAKTRTQKQRDSGAKKAALLVEVQTLVHSDTVSSLREALALVAEANNVSEGSLRRWWYDGAKMGKPINAFPQADWAVLLIPRHGHPVKTAEVHSNAWDWFCAYYLNQRQPTFAESYRRAVEAAEANGWGELPCLSTFKRRLKREFSPQEIIYKRQGKEAMMKLFPPQRRDKSVFQAGEAVNGDGLKFDMLYVEFPDGEIINTMTGWFWQDIRTNKILAYRLGKTENTDVFRLATYDLLGVCSPTHAWMDNTRVAANKTMTGGAHNRYRFSIKEDDPMGHLQRVGITPHFTNPSKVYGNSGAKPIERGFGVGGIHGKVASHPEFMNRGYSKKTAIPYEEVAKVVASEVARFNAQKGRRDAGCQGEESYDDLFNRLFQAAEVRMIPETDRALLLLMPEVVRVHSKRFEFQIKAGKGPWGSHRYRSESLTHKMGQKVQVYYDPANLAKDVSVYDLDGRFIAIAEHISDVGFNDTVTAGEYQKRKVRFNKSTTKAAEEKLRMDQMEVAALYPEAEAADIPEPGIIAMDFTRKRLEQEPLPKVANGEEGGARAAERYMNEVIQLPRRTEDDEF